MRPNMRRPLGGKRIGDCTTAKFDHEKKRKRGEIRDARIIIVAKIGRPISKEAHRRDPDRMSLSPNSEIHRPLSGTDDGGQRDTDGEAGASGLGREERVVIIAASWVKGNTAMRGKERHREA